MFPVLSNKIPFSSLDTSPVPSYTSDDLNAMAGVKAAFQALCKTRVSEYWSLKSDGGGLEPLDLTVSGNIKDLAQALSAWKGTFDEPQRQLALAQMMRSTVGMEDGPLKAEHATSVYPPCIFIWAQSLANPKSREVDYPEVLQQVLAASGDIEECKTSHFYHVRNNCIFKIRIDRQELPGKAVVFLDACNDLSRALDALNDGRAPWALTLAEGAFLKFDKVYTEFFEALLNVRREALVLRDRSGASGIEPFPWHGMKV